MGNPGVAALRRNPLWHAPWEDRAFCRGKWEFVDKSIKKQLEICHGSELLKDGPIENKCPVRNQCLELGLAQPLHAMGPKGMNFVYGGITPNALRELKKKRNKQKARAA